MLLKLATKDNQFLKQPYFQHKSVCTHVIAVNRSSECNHTLTNEVWKPERLVNQT